MRRTRAIPRSRRRWVETSLAGARFHNVDLTGAKMGGVIMVDAEIDGWISGLHVNGVEVAPLVERELRRLHPERAKMRSSDPKDLREAWMAIERRWRRTVARARRLPERLAHERVDGEWSFAETLRHLVFVADAWIGRPRSGPRTTITPSASPRPTCHRGSFAPAVWTGARAPRSRMSSTRAASA